MSLLLYCIFSNKARPQTSEIEGLHSRPVNIVCDNELCAAVSEIPSDPLPLHIPLLLDFQSVVEKYNMCETMIPMRYGCIVEDVAQVRVLLEQNREDYKAMLESLTGCTEMGLRFLLDEKGSDVPEPSTPPDKEGLVGEMMAGVGQTYLKERMRYHKGRDGFSGMENMLIENCRKTFKGEYVKWKAEKQEGLLSLYFLVRREKLMAFREKFRTMTDGNEWKCLLSGPWPPYNFVLQDEQSSER